jgi:hypothetical protein
MPYTERFSEVHQVGAELLLQNRAAAVYQSAWFNMSIHHRFAYVLQVGVIAAAGTVDLILQEAQDATGTGAAAIAGKAITQLTQAGGDGNDVVMIELRTEEMTPGFDFVRAQLTVGGNTAFTGGLGYGIINRFAPVATTLVTEIVG